MVDNVPIKIRSLFHHKVNTWLYCNSVMKGKLWNWHTQKRMGTIIIWKWCRFVSPSKLKMWKHFWGHGEHKWPLLSLYMEISTCLTFKAQIHWVNSCCLVWYSSLPGGWAPNGNEDRSANTSSTPSGHSASTVTIILENK